VDISYGAQPEAMPLSGVELWYTSDGGQGWRLYGSDPDRVPPVRFSAPEDGLFGFFLVLTNRFGVSSPPPAPGQREAHSWVMIDTSEPLVQVKKVHVLGNPKGQDDRLLIVWAAHDANIALRPVSIHYQIKEQPGWQLMASNVRNTGRFEWTIPAGLHGTLEVRVEVRDEAGNRSEDNSSPVTVSMAPQARAHEVVMTSPPTNAAAQGAPQVSPVTGQDMQRALELFELGVFHKERGDYALATERLIEALNADPEMTAPAFELAEIYYADGNYPRAIEIYQSIATSHPDDREAQRGIALASVALRDYPEALERLKRVLDEHPDDAQTWLDAGDVFIWMGQRHSAIQYWRQALDLSERRSPVWSKAQLKLKKFVPEERGP
jgi:Tfp pilus assembly protein PilF